MLASVQRTLAAYAEVHGRAALAGEFVTITIAALALCFWAGVFVMLEPLP